jgi:hypothetical protein
MLNSGSASKNKRCLSRPAVIWKKCVDNSHASASAERIELLDYETYQNLPAIRHLASERELSHNLLINTSSVINKFALLTDRKLQLLNQTWHLQLQCDLSDLRILYSIDSIRSRIRFRALDRTKLCLYDTISELTICFYCLLSDTNKV